MTDRPCDSKRSAASTPKVVRTISCSAIGLVLVALSPASARSVDVCPTLPAGGGIEWSYSEGPDFDVCYAHRSGSDETMFGIYLGHHPSFRPKRAHRIGRGKVAGRRIVWYRQNPSDTQAAFYRQTLLTLERGYLAHVWVAADTEPQMQDRLRVLERLQFKSP